MIMFGYHWRPMMNLKFRVWHKPSKKFIRFLKEHSPHGDLLINLSGNLMFDHSLDHMGACLIYEKDDYVIQLFTGMKDSCGVEVYEGDIVEKDNQTAEVFWSDTIGGFDLSWREPIHMQDESKSWFHFRNLLTMKVVGHINGI